MSIITRSLAPVLTLALAALCPTLAAAQSIEGTPTPSDGYSPAPSEPTPQTPPAGGYASPPPYQPAPPYQSPSPYQPPPPYQGTTQYPRALQYPAQAHDTERSARVYRPVRGRPIVGYRTETRNPPELWGTGIGLAAGGWLLNLVLTAAANSVSTERPPEVEQDAQAWAAVPFVGPLLQLALEAPHPAMPILTGLIQYAGLISFIVGVTTQQVNRAAIYEGSPDDPSMLRVELDASGGPDGGFVGITVRHL